MTYKFKKIHSDPEVSDIQREAEDNFATQNDLSDKENKIKDIQINAPELTDLSDGDKRVYFDGTNYWEYRRHGSKLLKVQLTLVV